MREATVQSVLASMLMVLVAPAAAQVKPVDLANPSTDRLELAADWAPAPLVRGAAEGEPISKSPFWCSQCASESGYEKGAAPASRPDTLLGRPATNMLETMKGEAKHKPIVCAARRMVVICHLKSASSRGLLERERAWMEAHFGKLKSKLDTHRLAHLWTLRAMQADAEWRDLMCLDPKREPHIPISAEVIWGTPPMASGELWLFAGDKPYREFSRQFCRFYGVRGHWWYEKKINQIATLTYGGKGVDKTLHARVTHLMSHHRLLEYRGFYNHSFTWIMEGLGHWFERRFDDYEDTFCKFGSPLPGQKDDGFGWTKTRWWPEVKRQVKSGNDLPVVKLASFRSDKHEFTCDAHAQSWSMVSYLLGFGKERWRRFVDVLEGQASSEAGMEALNRAFIAAYGHNAVVVQNAWKQWVKKTKPPKKRRR